MEEDDTPIHTISNNSNEIVNHDTEDDGTKNIEGLTAFIKNDALMNKKISQHVVIETFACALWKGFFDMKHRLYQIDNLDIQNAIKSGITLIDNLFWILFNCSSNLQLTLFLTERGRLLYSEFLSMSRTHMLMRNAETFPSIQDGFQFAIKKSIGTLTCCSCKDDMSDYYNYNYKLPFEKITMYRQIYRCIFENINKRYLTQKSDKPWTNDNVNISLHKLNHLLTSSIQKQNCTEIFFYITNIYKNELIDSFNLHSYLLFLKLICSRNFLKNLHISNELLIFERINILQKFINETTKYMDDSLQFLSNTHPCYLKWLEQLK